MAQRHSSRRAEFRRWFHREFLDLTSELHFPPLSTWFEAAPATFPEFETVLHKVLRWYESQTNYSLITGGLLHVHPRVPGREFLQLALRYTSMARMMRAGVWTNVEFRLRFRMRESLPRQVRVAGRLRLVTRREVYESLMEIIHVVGDEVGDSHEYGHHIHLWTEADPNGQADVRRHVFISGLFPHYWRVEFPDSDENTTSDDSDDEDTTSDGIDEDSISDVCIVGRNL